MQSYTRFACFITCVAISQNLSLIHAVDLQQTEYQGTLTTLNNRTINVSNISIAGRKNCVPVYAAPCNTDALLTCLSYNPKDKKVRLSLSMVKEIEIPYPYATWYYKPPNCRGKDNYLLIKIMWQDEKRPATHYLIEPKRRIGGRFKRNNTTTLSSIPFSGFKKCTINPMPR